MSLDPRSRERLEALGRQLPRPLPAPDAASEAAAPGASPPTRRHRIETEQDPEQLFRELMAASPDGTVPPHLLDRLRQLEGRRPSTPEAAGAVARGDERAAAPAEASRARRTPPPRGGRALRSGLSAEEQQQYASFAHLLLEQDDD